MGTIRTNKLKATSELLNKGTLQMMERRDYKFWTKESVAVTVWKDNEIYLISNAYPVSRDQTVCKKRKMEL